MSKRIVAAALFAGLAAAGLVAAFGLFADERLETSAEPIVVNIGGARLAVPRNAIRFAAQRTAAPLNRLDVAVLWPELEGRGADTAARFDTTGPAPDVLVATLTPAGAELDSAGRLATVWSRFFEGEPHPLGDGLVARRLTAASGYVDEEIRYEPGAVHPFAVRCFPLKPGTAPDVCLWVVIVDGLAVEWRLPIERLAERRRLADALPALVAGWKSAADRAGR